MDNLSSIFFAMSQGIFDSFRGIAVVFYLDKEIKEKQLERSSHASTPNRESNSNQTPITKIQSTDNKEKEQPEECRIATRVLQCCVLNGGIFWLSIAFFEYVVLPGLKLLTTNIMGTTNLELGFNLWRYLKPSLTVLFALIWILPLFVMSKIINSLWFQDIADSAYKFRKGRPQYIPTISKLIADVLMNLLVEALFLGQSMLVNLIPIRYLGTALSFIHICLLYSLYSFEYKWFNMGWELHKRLTFIEYNWPYFIGFGLPLAILTEIPRSFLVSGCVFSIIFPLLILSSNEANPKINTCDFSLRLFSPVILISNALFSRKKPAFSYNQVAATSKISSATPPASSSHQKYVFNDTPRSTPSPTLSQRRHHTHSTATTSNSSTRR